eukprot:TRINITY_DN2545_c2_g1_i1.p1 TRINITY_DN2545_c2_g1~~TRINITY_DN2545_c2_g1_i1.p1  ORF type:complete len:232 (+),score=22.74 TRINITY_DN2545_c2_g1_i1:349-1044(+)
MVNPPNDSDAFCTFQGFLFNFSNLASTLWNSNLCLYMTIYIISTSISGMKNLPGTKYELFSQLIWIFCGFLSFFGFTLVSDEYPYFYGSVGRGVWCWIGNPYNPQRMTLHYIWIFMSFGLLLILTLINCFYLYCNTGKFGDEIDKRIGGVIRTLTGYPIIFSFTVIFPLIITRMMDGLEEVTINAARVGSILFASNGLFNAIYYGFSRHIYSKWKVVLFHRSSSQEVSTSS